MGSKAKYDKLAGLLGRHTKRTTPRPKRTNNLGPYDESSRLEQQVGASKNVLRRLHEICEQWQSKLMKQASDSEMEVFRICWSIHVDHFCPCFRYGALRIVLAGLHEASKSSCDTPLLSYATSHGTCPDLLRLEQALPQAGSRGGPVLSAWTWNMSEGTC